MNIKKQLGTTAITTVMLAAAGPALAAGTPASADPAVAYFHATERATLVQSAGPAAIAYFRANERKTLAESAGPAAIEFFRANERKTLASEVPASLEGTVDGDGNVVEAASPAVKAESVQSRGFDWRDAALGASSALMLGLLIGASLIVVRHSRGRELAR